MKRGDRVRSILCFGDSNTWGFMPWKERPAIKANNRFPWEVRWTGRLERALRFAEDDTCTDHEAIAALGEGSIFIFESINRGERSADDVDWVRKMLESKLTSTVVKKSAQAVKEVGSETDLKKIAKIVADTFLKKP